MAKYMFQVSYTLEGVNGLLKTGGSAREKAVGDLVRSLGGDLEGFYYAFGGADLYIIADLPDDAAATALSLRVAASGAGAISTTVLLDPSTVDEAVKRDTSYTPPGVLGETCVYAEGNQHFAGLGFVDRGVGCEFSEVGFGFEGGIENRAHEFVIVEKFAVPDLEFVEG